MQEESCPLCRELPGIQYMWYCPDCNRPVHTISAKVKLAVYHKTSNGRCSRPMIFAKVRISCPHQYLDHDAEISYLNDYPLPVPTQIDLFPNKSQADAKFTKSRKANGTGLEQRSRGAERIGLTPVDPKKWQGMNE